MKTSDGSDIIIRRKKLADYRPSPRNPNQGSGPRGLAMIEDSFREDGAARSMVAAANDTIIAGNHAIQGAIDAGFDEAIEIEVDGHTPVIVKRKDWEDENDPQAVRYSYRDNQSTVVNLTWNPEQISLDYQGGLDFTPIFTDSDLAPFLSDEPPLNTTGNRVSKTVKRCPHCGEVIS